MHDSWSDLVEDSVCVCLCVSQLEDVLGPDGERQHGKLVQLCEGSEG